MRTMKLKLGMPAKDITLYKRYVFYSGRIKTLVAMVTYSFNRLIVEKVEIAISAVSLGILKKKYRMVY